MYKYMIEVRHTVIRQVGVCHILGKRSHFISFGGSATTRTQDGGSARIGRRNKWPVSVLKSFDGASGLGMSPNGAGVEATTTAETDGFTLARGSGATSAGHGGSEWREWDGLGA